MAQFKPSELIFSWKTSTGPCPLVPSPPATPPCPTATPPWVTVTYAAACRTGGGTPGRGFFLYWLLSVCSRTRQRKWGQRPRGVLRGGAGCPGLSLGAVSLPGQGHPVGAVPGGMLSRGMETKGACCPGQVSPDRCCHSGWDHGDGASERTLSQGR